MQSNLYHQLRRRSLAFLLALLLCALFSPALAQNTYDDLEGRFALDLPKGWKLKSEQMNLVYQFGSGQSTTMIILNYIMGTSSREEAFADQVENMVNIGYSAPPAGTVVDMTVNDCPARWAEYPFELEVSGKKVQLHAYLGAVVGEDEGGAGFLAFMSSTEKTRVGDAVKHAFETLRLHGRPLTGVRDVVEVSKDYAAAVGETPAGPSQFEHELFSVMLPPGWSSEPGKDEVTAVFKHKDFGSLSVTGKEKNKLGKNRDEILIGFRDGLLSSIPSMQNVRGPWEVTTNSGEILTVEEFTGSIAVMGKNFPHGALIAAAKNGNRGLGFLGIYSSKVKEEAVADMLAILKSLK